MNAEIISIGDELLIGQIANTNAAYLCKYLTAIGVEVKWVTTVGDDAEELRRALTLAMERSDVTITTGGLGPTHDDITKHVVADFFGSNLVMNQEILTRLKAAFAERGIKMAAVNQDQALVPDNAEVIDNPVGTAPALLFERNGKKCFVLPGVPSEMKAISEASIFPTLKGQQRIVIRTVRTTGIAESTLFERLGHVDELGKWLKVAFLPKAGGVDIRLMATGMDLREGQDRIARGVQYIAERVGDYIYGYDDDELENVVGKLLSDRKQTVAVAESCTGGLLAHWFTNISGSSSYFECGVIAYSNHAKICILGVSAEIIEKHGAVSSEAAVAMAEGVRRSIGTDFGVSTTGIAGPTGGTAEKPVGLVYIGLATPEKSYSRRFLFYKDRLLNKERSVRVALDLLRKELLKRSS